MTFISAAAAVCAVLTICTVVESSRLMKIEELILEEFGQSTKSLEFNMMLSFIKMRNRWVRRENLQAALIRMQNKDLIEKTDDQSFRVKR
jgi:hypothetical protein